MASMKDVARLAGVSVSTVSRVVNKNIPVDEQTRKRVENAIDKVNYKPNLLARGLRSKSGHMIGLAVPEILHQAFTYWIKYCEECAAEYGMNLIIGNTQNNPDKEEAFINSLIQRQIDGIIFSRVSDKSRILHILDKTDIPVIVLDRALDKEDVPAVVLDNYRAGRLAGGHLVSQGHKKIACITGPLDIALSRERLQGLKEILEENGIDLKDGLVAEGDFKYETGVAGAQQLLRSRISFTAVWAQSDLMAIGLMNELRKQGLSVPEDVSVIGMDDISMAEIKLPALTTISQPYREMCRLAIEMIIRQRKEGVVPEKRVCLQPSLVVRDSTRKV